MGEVPAGWHPAGGCGRMRPQAPLHGAVAEDALAVVVGDLGDQVPAGRRSPLALKPTGWAGHEEQFPGATLAEHLCSGWELPAPPGLLYHHLEWKQIPLFIEEGLRFASCPSHQ